MNTWWQQYGTNVRVCSTREEFVCFKEFDRKKFQGWKPQKNWLAKNKWSFNLKVKNILEMLVNLWFVVKFSSLGDFIERLRIFIPKKQIYTQSLFMKFYYETIGLF
jgi:hypothetical protein